MGSIAIVSRGAARAAVALTMLVVAWSAHAASAPTIDDFVGRFSGVAQSEAGDRFFVTSLRDVEVELQREGEAVPPGLEHADP